MLTQVLLMTKSTNPSYSISSIAHSEYTSLAPPPFSGFRLPWLYGISELFVDEAKTLFREFCKLICHGW